MKNIWLFSVLSVMLTCKALTAQQLETHQNVTNTLITNVSLTPGNMQYQFKDTSSSKNLYLEKSKNQKKAGRLLLRGGAVIGVVGALMVGHNFELFRSEQENNESAADLGVALFFTGAGCAITSIPFFISSARNARRAATLSINKQEILLPRHAGMARKIQPAFTVAFPIK